MATRMRVVAWAVLAALLMLALVSRAAAVPVVLYTTTDLGGGLFEYDLTIYNNGGSGTVSGLLVVKGNSVFGLDSLSEIGAPQDVGGDPNADWSFFAPIPSVVDDLDYFSLDPAGDVPVGGTLSGFFFKSTADPAQLAAGDFEMNLVVNGTDANGDPTATQVPVEAKFLPEPSAPLLFAAALLALLARRGRTIFRGRQPRGFPIPRQAG